MPDSKITALTQLTDIAFDDQIEIVDTSAGASKRILLSDLYKLPLISDPSAPGAGFVKIYAKNISGRALPKWVGPAGIDTPFQPALFGNNVALWVPSTGTTASINFGCPWTARNAGTSAAQATPAIATTNLYTMMKRAEFGTGTTTTGSSGTQSGSALCARGNATGIGGFFFMARFGISSTNFLNSIRVFVGLSALNAAIAGEPSAQNHSIVCGKDSGDTTWQVITRDGTTANKTNLGQTMAGNDIIDFYLFCKPNDSKVTARVVLQTASGPTVLMDNTDLTTNLPGNTQLLFAHAQIMATAGTTAKSLGLNRLYVETDI